MNVADIAVVIAAIAALAGLGWFFFAPRRAHTADLAGGVQRITVTVRGGYSPDVIRARQGVPLEVVFDRQESGDCTSRVVFPDLAMSASLPAFEQTTVRLAAPAAGLVRLRVRDEHDPRHPHCRPRRGARSGRR